MWANFLFLVAAGLASAEHGWRSGHQYTYQIQSSTLTGLQQAADQYSGVHIKGQLTVQASSDNQLNLQVRNAKYAEFQRNLSQGVATDLSELDLSYQKFPLSESPFQLYFRNSTIQKMVVDKNIPQWELNFLKGIANQFQLDTQGENEKKSKINMVPKKNEYYGTYKTTEDSLPGNYEMSYDISVLPDFVLQSRPELAPLPHLKGDGHHINIVKTTNFTKSKQRVGYKYGASGREDWTVGYNHMGNFLSKSLASRAVVSGTIKNYTVQSVVTVEKISVAPHFHDNQKGIVYSQLNATLQAVSQQEEPLPEIAEPKSIKNLVYEYAEGNQRRTGRSSEKHQSASNSQSSSSSSSSESSSSSSEETVNTRGDNHNSLTGQYHQKQSKSKDSYKDITRKEIHEIHDIKRHKRSWQSSEPRKLEEMSASNDEHSSSSSSSSESSSSSSSSESSSEEYLQREPEMNEAPKIEFIPNYFGSYGSQPASNLENIRKVAQKIGKWIQNPSRIPEEHNLAYFSLLSQLVASSSSEQLNQATEMLYYPESKVQQQQQNPQEAQNYHAWLAYRDAVAQAGTGPALVTLREWINNGKVQGEEAAQLVATLPNAARYPTTEYMNYFFEMIKSGEVQKQQALNNSAIISFSELVRKSQVDSESSRNRYSIHLTGGQSQHHARVVRENYIPYFQSQLNKAIQQEDSIKAQVYIRALGSTAHPTVMAAFEPYLEGKKQATSFQRLSMIAALDEMTRVHPNLARSVLYRVYQNQGDIAEIRAAAVAQLMKTNPPAQMLQRMADMTNYDSDKQVNAVVKSAIESAASSQEYDASELSANARAAVNMLTPETYGAEYSKNFIRSYIVKEQEQLHYKQHATYVQNQSFFPSALFYEVDRSIGGYKRDPYVASLMMSNADQLWDMLSDKFSSSRRGGQQQSDQESGSYSYEKISNMLNLQPEARGQLEGSFLLNLLGGKRYFSFDNHTIEQLPKRISEFHEKLQKGINLQYSKLYNQYSMELSYPLINGFHFTYSLDVPTLVSYRGQFKGYADIKSGPSAQAGVNGTLHFTYSAQKRGQMGFAPIFNNRRYMTGVDKNILINLPVQGSIEFNRTDNKLQAKIQPPSQNNERQKLFQFSSSVFTTSHRNDDIRPYQEGENVQYVHSKPMKHYQTTVAHEESGYAVDVEASSEQNFMDMASLYRKYRNHDFVSFIAFHDMGENIGNSRFALSYNPSKSSPQPVRAGFSYMTDEEDGHRSSRFIEKSKKHFRQVRSDDGNMAQPSNHQHRREELLSNAKSGIQDAKARVFDAFISFGAEDSSNGYSFTVAHAKSPATKNSRLLVNVYGSPVKPSENSKPFQASMQLNIQEPLLSAFNYAEAMNADPSTAVEGQIHLSHGEQSPGRISFKGEMKRSQERKEYLQQHPLSSECQEQMKEGNYIQPACRNATTNAYYLDQYDFAAQYQNLPAGVKESLYRAYGWVRQIYYPNHEENITRSGNPEGQMTVQVRFARDLQHANASIRASSISAAFTNVKLNQHVIPLAVYNARYSQAALYLQKLLHQQPIFTAVLDGNQVTTFNNRTYPVQLGDCYHVFSMYAPQSENHNGEEQNTYRNSERNFAILVKERDNQQKDARIIIGNNEISLESGSGKPTIRANGKDLPLTESRVTRWSSGQNSLEAHQHSDNTVVLHFPYNGFEVVYDGKRIQLSLNPVYRNSVRGLAGSFDGEMAEDYTLPNSRISQNSEDFYSSYALADSSCQGPAKQRHEQAKAAKSYAKEAIFGNVISDREAGRSGDASGRYNHLSPKQLRTQQSCSVYGLKVIEDNGRTCFSTKPLVTCRPECKPTRSLQKTIDFHCIPHSSDSRRWVEMIKKGDTPDFSQKIPHLKVAVNLPESCTPK